MSSFREVKWFSIHSPPTYLIPKCHIWRIRRIPEPSSARMPFTQMTIGARPLLKTTLGLSASGLLLAAAATHIFPKTPSANMSSSPAVRTWPVKPHTPRPWTYNPSDFTRQDPRPDGDFYSAPRFVTHIDDAAIASLREYYDAALPRGSSGVRILDFCSSWISHYPARIEAAAAERSEEGEGGGEGQVRVAGMGMNRAELDANPVLRHGRILLDLNADDADVAVALRQAGVVGEGKAEKLDAATCVVSIDYLTRPVEVLRSLRGVMKGDGLGTVHLIVSNRCFPTKAISRWLRVDEEERLQMVGDFLHAAGWSKIEIMQLSDGTVSGGQANAQTGGMQGLMTSIMGMGRRDPLWVVRAVNE